MDYIIKRKIERVSVISHHLPHLYSTTFLSGSDLFPDRICFRLWNPGIPESRNPGIPESRSRESLRSQAEHKLLTFINPNPRLNSKIAQISSIFLPDFNLSIFRAPTETFILLYKRTYLWDGDWPMLHTHWHTNYNFF